MKFETFYKLFFMHRFKNQHNIYKYEIDTLSKCILENKKEPNFPGMTINETLENMRILDKWLN
jgi:hypothetical protein